jgi:predicted TPR repeat methyltransferase
MERERVSWLRKVAHSIVNLRPLKTFLTENRWFVRHYFDYLYATPDPYDADSEFEAERFERAFSSVAGSRFKKALEIGCGEGSYTWRIAIMSDSLLATDLSVKAIRRAAARNMGPSVRFQTLDIVSDTLDDRFDYLFCGDVLHYVSLRQMDAVVEKIQSLLTPGGVLHLLHYRSTRDDGGGLELKEYGAKTIHDKFVRHSALELVKDEVTSIDRTTLLRKKQA